jgi:hypothetical protein
MRIASAFVAVVAPAGCGGAALRLVSPGDAIRRATAVHADWRYNATHFPQTRTAATAQLITSANDPRLVQLSRRYDFQIISFRYLRPTRWVIWEVIH